MKIVPIQDINKQQLHLTEIYIMLQFWNNDNYSFMETPRARDAFTLYLEGSATYTFVNPETKLQEILYVSKGDLVYLPKNCRYFVTFHPDGEKRVSDYLLDFAFYDENFRETILADRPKRVLRGVPTSLIDNFATMRKVFKDVALNTNQLQSLAFQILSKVGSLANAKSIKKQGYGAIAPGIAYMESHLSEDFSIAQLAEKCNVSETYFRRQFKEYTGKSPLQYKNDLVIQKASLLLSSMTLSMQEISDSLGFCDCAYFCRVFKKSTGLTPSEYIEKTLPDRW